MLFSPCEWFSLRSVSGLLLDRTGGSFSAEVSPVVERLVDISSSSCFFSPSFSKCRRVITSFSSSLFASFVSSTLWSASTWAPVTFSFHLASDSLSVWSSVVVSSSASFKASRSSTILESDFFKLWTSADTSVRDMVLSCCLHKASSNWYCRPSLLW